MTRRRKLSVIIYILSAITAVCVILGCDYEKPYHGNYIFYTLRCHRLLTCYKNGMEPRVVGKFDVFNIALDGIAHRNKYYSIRGSDLLSFDLITAKTKKILDLKTILGEFDTYGVKLIFAGDTYFYIARDSIYKDGKVVPAYGCVVSKYNRVTGDIEELMIPNCQLGTLEYGEKTYVYIDVCHRATMFKDGSYIHFNYMIRAIAISPDGKTLAFIIGDSLHSKIYIYDIDSKKTKLIKTFYTTHLKGKIKWSPDGNLLGVMEFDNMGSNDVFVVSVHSGAIIRTIKKSRACYWFFNEE